MERLLAAHVKEAPPRMHKIGCSFVPAAVESVVQLALSKFPNERQQNGRELLESYGRAMGLDLWGATAPPDWEPGPKAPVPEPLAETVPMPTGPFNLMYGFAVSLPERMAAAKLRGFVEDFRGEVLASEPGLIRMRIGLPTAAKKPAGLLGWFGNVSRPAVEKGQEPMEVELYMEKPDPAQTRLNVLVSFQPIREYPPKDRKNWANRCEKVHNVLRQYLGAQAG
jgi:hypothetical protein